jgi:hypothetical protein
MNLRPYIGNYISGMTKMCNTVPNPVDMFGMAGEGPFPLSCLHGYDKASANAIFDENL